ncbi:MerR family transcriptional regulator [Levilactobacillus suantsaiihabitans]|uniref:Transcription regulator MerR DNA binding domain-containing protein n=1 Tax=Levilactobacillus suantsaiihabitans TaxID=2487722 RepID=A0A4Z0JA66_9LACO|nr:MerR family DNA-binding protein [Levilactobacillus suantsaiihabitans]TGD19657.1 hypothetical protein EGT51_03905 [Levilactobacillus suantsaiihabitans]
MMQFLGWSLFRYLEYVFLNEQNKHLTYLKNRDTLQSSISKGITTDEFAKRENFEQLAVQEKAVRLVNRDDVQAKYHFPSQLLSDYESWRVKQFAGQLAPTYTPTDIEALRLMLRLQQIGFSSHDIEDFLALNLRKQGPPAELIAMLTQHRQERLAAIHHYERQIAGIDYLRFQLTENH